MTVNADELNATLTLNTQHKFFGDAKQLRGLRPFARTKTRALILLLARVAAAQSDLCVITFVLHEEPLAVSKIAGIVIKLSFDLS